MKQKPRNWVIAANGGYFDGLRGGRPLAEAKRYSRSEARILNRVIFCGNARLAHVKGWNQ